jgi:hypothetical protein
MAERPPYESYAVRISSWAIPVTGWLARRRDRDPQCHSWLDLAVLAAATFKASRTLSHDEVTSFLREPFVRGHAHEGGEEPKPGGMEQAIGELITCSRCIGMWAAAGVVGMHTVAPRSGRLLTWSLAASAANDFLQAGFSALAAKANELEQRGG